MGVFEPAPEVSRIDLASEPEFEVGGLTVKPSERAVVRNGERRELQPRVMRVLIALAQARPVVVSRDRLIERCWEGRIVGDDALNRCILAPSGAGVRPRAVYDQDDTTCGPPASGVGGGKRQLRGAEPGQARCSGPGRPRSSPCSPQLHSS